MSRNARRAVVLFGCALTTRLVAGPIDVLFPITEVGLHEDAARATRMKSLGTAFGRASLRQADYVISGGSWASGRLQDRAPSVVTDLDLASDEDEAGALGGEVAVMFGRGFSSLQAGPDVFMVGGARATARSMTVTPVYRVNGQTLVEGEPALLSPEASFGFVSAGGRDLGGVGIDLDGWRVQGLAPEGALIVGVVFRAADGDQLAPMRLMLGDNEDPGEYMDRRPGGGSSRNGLLYRGGARDQNGSGSGQPEPALVPASPISGAALAAMALLGLRRRRV